VRKIYKFDLSGNFICSYNSIKEASIKENISLNRMYLSVRNCRRIKEYVYSKSMEYVGTIYNHNKGKNEASFTEGFTVKQVCELIDKSKFKVYELLNSNILKGYKKNNIWCISEESVFKYLKER
jgi:hypothetical protein